MNKLYFLFILLFFQLNTFGQESNSRKNKVLKSINITSVGLAYTASTYNVTQHFFKDYPYSKFHFKIDTSTWQGMDKAFHAFGSYQMNSLFYEANLLSGIDSSKALNIAFMESVLFSCTKEWADGHINISGWSWHDISMNLSGNIAFIVQEKLWGEQRFKFKYSYFSSGLQHYNPEVLGNSVKNYWLHDYNGQTYWLSSSLGNWKLTSNPWLKPISISFGYGAHNMLNEWDNTKITSDPIYRYKQYYLGLDINWSQIKTNKKVLKTLFFILDRFRFPLPSLEFTSQGQVKFHPIKVF
jgi:uncharacterized protein YfiM (DUF2279 family)